MSRTIHFIGANGIPWRVYQPLIKTLEGKGFAVQCDDTVGLEFGTCDDKWGNQDWTHMVDRYVAGVEASKKSSPGEAIGVGHSFGGAIMMCAAARRPGIFDRIIVHDPPMFSLPKRAAFAAILKFYPSLAPAVFPPLKPRKVVEWASMDDASSYLKGRGAMFREMSPESFQFFLQHGLKRKGGSSVELTWPARAEALLFRTAPMDIPVLSPAHLGLYDAKNLPPGHFLFSQSYSFLGKGDVASLRRRLGASLQFTQVPGGHFYPLGDAASYSNLLENLLAESTLGTRHLSPIP